MSPTKSGKAVRFVILAAPRTGSNWLCTVLDSHPEVLCHHEIFNPEGIHYSLRYRGGELDFGDPETRDQEPLRVLERVWAEALGHRAVGFKMTRGQAADVMRHAVRDSDVLKLVLRRANRIKTLVSEKIARTTGAWESYDGIESRSPTVTIAEAELRAHGALNEAFYRKIDEDLARTGQVPLQVTYEHLASSEERRRILEFLGISESAVSLRGSTRKQNPKDLRQLIANFEDLCERLRGTSFEDEILDSRT